MRRHFTLIGLAMLLAAAGASASRSEEIPSVSIVPNAPGAVTVSYYHSGTGGVAEYRIESKGGHNEVMYSPNGVFTDTFLTPETWYEYRVCAVYWEDAEAACSDWVPVRTLSLAAVDNFEPPLVMDFDVGLNSITVHWGAVGTYSTILARIEDGIGSNQVDLRSAPNASYTFQNLREGARYRILLKGCSPSLIDSNCGEWSPEVFITTAVAAPAYTPPSSPSIQILYSTETLVALSFSVDIAYPNYNDRFILMRDGAEHATVEPLLRAGGWSASYTDTVDLAHTYTICFASVTPVARVCSGTIADMNPSRVGLQDPNTAIVPIGPPRSVDVFR